jgi:hypothetical protein
MRLHSHDSPELVERIVKHYTAAPEKAMDQTLGEPP